MEANEVQELKEHAEHGASDSGLRPVAFTMSLLAVLVAMIRCSAIARTPKRYSSRTSRPTYGINIRPTRFAPITQPDL